LCLCLVGAASAAEQQKQKSEHYSAVAVGTRGMVGGQSLNMDFIIKEYSTDGQIQEYLAILEKGGVDALRRALEKLDVGQASPAGRVGVPIAVARARKTESGTLISIITARNMPFFELRYAGRTTDYPFSVVQLEVDEKGNGEGAAIVAARIKFDKEGMLVIESYGMSDTVRLVNVRRY